VNAAAGAGVAAIAGALVLGAQAASPGRSSTPSGDPSKPTFADVTEAVGIRWGISTIALRGWNLVETMGGGGGFVDYDGDGLLDVYLVSYSREPQGDGKPVGDALFRNRGDGTFKDVTAQAGIRGTMRGMGLTVGDYDNDGRPDLYVTGYGAHKLWRNQGDGTFQDATVGAGLNPPPRWGTSAAFFDYDADGRLDLFVASYLDFDPEGKFPCDLIDERPFCSIDRFRGSSGVLYHNDGNGVFTNTTVRAGLNRPGAKGMGVVAADIDNDGRVDVFQANDTAPNDLFLNRGDGTFGNVALEAEVAYDPAGRALGAMGVDVDDQDGDGLLDIFVANFTNQANQLFRNGGAGAFRDVAGALGLATVSLPMSGFGARFLDYDNDGRVDLAVANGHPFAPVARVWPGITYAERPFLFENTGSGFREVGQERGDALARAYVGRGLATGDYDNDGDPDLLLLCVGEPPRLLRNDGGHRGNWIGVTLVGTSGNRDAVGARVTVIVGGRGRTKVRVGGSSYLSASDPRLLFGVGEGLRVDQVEVRWPNGRLERFSGFAVRQYVTLKEGEGKAAHASS
jgi:enediyne biosynthesis protein E4